VRSPLPLTTLRVLPRRHAIDFKEPTIAAAEAPYFLLGSDFSRRGCPDDPVTSGESFRLRFHRERAGQGIGRLGNCFVDGILIIMIIFVKKNN